MLFLQAPILLQFQQGLIAHVTCHILYQSASVRPRLAESWPGHTICIPLGCRWKFFAGDPTIQQYFGSVSRRQKTPWKTKCINMRSYFYPVQCLMWQEYAYAFPSDHNRGLGRDRQRGGSCVTSPRFIICETPGSDCFQVMKLQPWTAGFFILYSSCLSLRWTKGLNLTRVVYRVSVYQLKCHKRHCDLLKVTTFAILNVMIAVIVESTLDEANKSDEFAKASAVSEILTAGRTKASLSQLRNGGSLRQSQFFKNKGILDMKKGYLEVGRVKRAWALICRGHLWAFWVLVYSSLHFHNALQAGRSPKSLWKNL